MSHNAHKPTVHLRLKNEAQEGVASTTHNPLVHRGASISLEIQTISSAASVAESTAESNSIGRKDLRVMDRNCGKTVRSRARFTTSFATSMIATAAMMMMMMTTAMFTLPRMAGAARSPFNRHGSKLASSACSMAFMSGRPASPRVSRHLQQRDPSFTVPVPKSTSALASASTSENVASSKTEAPITPLARSWIRKTPLVYSPTLSQLASNPVYLKLDLLQPSGSFKDRGMAHLCTSMQQTQGVSKFISSSGGNAGLAVTTVAASAAGPFAQDIDLSVDVIVPETTKPLVVQKLKDLGASVTVQGENWNAADAVARKRAAGANGDCAAYVNPFDDALLWTGHSSVVDEIIEDLEGKELGAIVVSVGGGGLLCGVLEGLARTQNQDGVTVVAAETKGAASFAASWDASLEQEALAMVTLPGIASVATSLGATCVTPAVIERGQSHVAAGGILESATMDDASAVSACMEFADEYRMLVEPACGAALAVVYDEALRQKHLKDIPKGKAIVIEVCGGSGVNIDLLQQWKSEILE